MMKWSFLLLGVLSLPAIAGQAEINKDCMAHAQAFNVISNNAVGFYPNRELSQKLLRSQAPKTNPPEAGIRFAKGVIAKVYQDDSFRRILRDAGQVDLIMPYYRNCLEEPDKYLSDYDNVK